MRAGLRTIGTLGLLGAGFLRSLATPEPYLVIDLAGGSIATNYPVTYLSEVPAGGWTDEFKTTKLVLRRLPATSPDFAMGAPVGELGRHTDEVLHSVAITRDFHIGVFEVTQRQWELVMGTLPSYYTNAAFYATRPVERVSHYMIRENPANGADPTVSWPTNSTVGPESFMGLLRAKTGLAALDLPTEAQWEYACRAGTATALNSGHNLTNHLQDARMAAVGRYLHNGGDGQTQSSDTSRGTAVVGSYAPNAWGLYDMHGNAWEKCLDGHGSYAVPASDPGGPLSGTSRVMRGGSWYDHAFYCRSAMRGQCPPGGTSFNDGFRVVLPVVRSLSLEGNLSFGSIAVGQTAIRTLAIRNTSAAAVVVTSIACPSGFTADWTAGSIAPSARQDVTVTFRPTAAQDYAGDVVVSSDAAPGLHARAAAGSGAGPIATLVVLDGLDVVYDGWPKAVTLTTDPTNVPVSVLYDGSATAPTAAGSYAVVATVTDPGHQGSATGTLNIAKAGQTINFPTPADQPADGPTVVLAATATSGLPVAYQLVTGPATLAGSTLTLTGIGTVLLEATQGGDANWNAAPPVQQSFASLPPHSMAPTGSVLLYGRRPALMWPPVAGATWYQIWVTRNGATYTSSWVQGISQWISAEDLPGGRYTWWVRGWSPANGMSPWSPAATFFVAVQPPGSVPQLGPSGEQAEVDLLYRWQEVPHAAWYRVWTARAGSATTVDRWVRSTGAAEGRLAVSGHPAGDYSWWIRGWGVDGYGPWTGPMAFTIPTAAAGKPTLLAPSGATATRRPTFEWQAAPRSQWYRVYVRRGTSVLIDRWTQGTSLVPEADLPSGDCAWWVGAWSSATRAHTWSERMTFVVP